MIDSVRKGNRSLQRTPIPRTPSRRCEIDPVEPLVIFAFRNAAVCGDHLRSESELKLRLGTTARQRHLAVEVLYAEVAPVFRTGGTAVRAW